MARFKATIKGARGEASRLGNADTGLSTTVNGWNLGVRVDASTDGPADVFNIYLTGGSNEPGRTVYIGQVIGTDGGMFFPAPERPEAPPPEGRAVKAGVLPAHGARANTGDIIKCAECGEDTTHNRESSFYGHVHRYGPVTHEFRPEPPEGLTP